MDTLLGGKEIVIYGGKGYKLSESGLFLSDTWRLDLGEKKEWLNLSTQAPAARWKTGTAPVQSGKTWVLFGGCIGVSVSGVQNDLWVFSATSGTWREVSTENPPAPRRGHVVVTNATHLIVFGGKSWREGTVTVEKDLWALPLSALDEGAPLGRWTQGASLPAAARWGASGTVVRQHSQEFSSKCLLGCKKTREILVIYGGRVKVHKEYVYFESLYVYEFISDTWNLVEPCGHKPVARDHHVATALDGKLWIFGGRTEAKRSFHSDVADLWSYSITENRWKHHKWKGSGPSRRFMPGITSLEYNKHPAIAVFGGEHFAKRSERTLWDKKWELLNDLWVFDTVKERWTEISPSNCPGIPASAEPSIELDEESDEELLEMYKTDEEVRHDDTKETDEELAICSIADSLSFAQWVLVLSVAFITAALGVGFAIGRPRIRSANARTSAVDVDTDYYIEIS